MPVDLKSVFWRYKQNGRNPFIFAGFGDVRSKNVETHVRKHFVHSGMSFIDSKLTVDD